MKEDIRVRLDSDLNCCSIEFIDRLEISVIYANNETKELEIEAYFNVYTDKEYVVHSADFTDIAFNSESVVVLSNLENTEFLLKKVKRNKKQVLEMFKNSTLLL